MGKRSSFEKLPKDQYMTIDPRAVEALLPFLSKGTKFVEPCVGKYDLADALENAGHRCVNASDVEAVLRPGDTLRDARGIDEEYCAGADQIITNPPWERSVLHEMIVKFLVLRPTWLLFDADWMHTKQSSEYMDYCSDIVSVGRLIWIPGTKVQGKDNCAWYRFDKNTKRTIFHGR